jgi:alpha-D-xyloside xylohydrolase
MRKMINMKKARFFSITYCICLFCFLTSFRPGPDLPSYIKTSDGVIIYPDNQLSGNVRSVRLQVITQNIIRVMASPEKEPKKVKSLAVNFTGEPIKWDLITGKENLVLKTKAITATISLKSGTVYFSDLSGKRIINEKSMGRTMEPVTFDGQRLWHLSQTFQTTEDDAWYGLGQHQDGQYNYKGGQVTLFQNNTEVGVPFLISKKNYGILWDNYSLTDIGDIRALQPLTRLKLFARDGTQGWLSASYKNDKDAEKVDMERPETDINYEFLNDLKMRMPEGFKPTNGRVVWEGSIASDLDGVHKLRFTYAGYIKVWVDGKLMLDRWRQAWNPGAGLVDVPMQKGKKYALKIDWIPNGGESYISAKWQQPVLASEQNSYGFSSEAGQLLDYYFVYGNNMDEVIAGYRKLTGKATMIPKWALGFWQSRERYKTQGEILGVVNEFRKRKIPLDNIVEDWSYWKENDWGSQEFDPTRFPSPDSMIKVLHDQYHTHFMISVWPKFYEGINTYNEFNQKGWLYKRNIADRQRDWIGQGYVSTFYDAFNEGARKGFWDLINNKLFTKGVDAWWMDASEPDILSNVSPERRKQQMTPTALGPSAEYLNAYPLENARGIYEGQRATRPNQRVFILTRSAFAGSQRYAAATWSGDIAARWHDMKAQISAGINFSMSGIPYWTMDIGGFAVENRYEHPKADDLEEWREQVTRWYQFGVFVPLFRVHGQFPYREIYNTAPEDHPAYKSMLYYDQLRYRLMPYIYSLAGMAYHQDYTIMRGLVMDFPKDSAVNNIGDQYLFGPSLLINPVYDYKQKSRNVYLPKGQGWYDFYTGKYYNGGQSLDASAPYERIPVFVKEGSILPFGPDLQFTSERPADTITLYVYTGANGHFSIYEDEDINYNYEKGSFSQIPITYSEATQTLSIGKRQGSFPGMLQKRTFQIVWVSKETPKALDFNQQVDAVVQYSGSPLSVPLKHRK